MQSARGQRSVSFARMWLQRPDEPKMRRTALFTALVVPCRDILATLRFLRSLEGHISGKKEVTATQTAMAVRTVAGRICCAEMELAHLCMINSADQRPRCLRTSSV
eukprot:SAG11_NODE_17542_length_515_cov_1.225962_1_plen_105_part_10